MRVRPAALSPSSWNFQRLSDRRDPGIAVDSRHRLFSPIYFAKPNSLKEKANSLTKVTIMQSGAAYLPHTNSTKKSRGNLLGAAEPDGAIAVACVTAPPGAWPSAASGRPGKGSPCLSAS